MQGWLTPQPGGSSWELQYDMTGPKHASFSFSFLFFFQAAGGGAAYGGQDPGALFRGIDPIRTLLTTSVHRGARLKLMLEISYTRTVSPQTLYK